MRPEREIAGQSPTNRRIVADATDRVSYFIPESVAKSSEAIFVITPGGSQLLAGFCQEEKI
jgi:hypothetical protein